MFEYPGSRMSDDLYNDVKDIKAWLNRFVPELEQQMANLGTDNFTTAYNERLEGLTTLTGAAGSKTTADAVAEHLLDYNNPHRVSLSQLGYIAPELKVETKNDSTILTLCGLMIQLKPVSFESATASATGNIYYRSVSGGDWEKEFGELYTAFFVVDSGSRHWPVRLTSKSKTSAGTLIMYCSREDDEAGTATVIGIGRA